MPKSQRKIKIPDDEIPGTITALLESFFWLPTIRPMTAYGRLHDDHDGTNRGDINIMFSPDGDARVWTTDREGRELEALRFRMPTGGGMSQRTRTALIILAEAIRLDNEGPVR